MSGIFGFFSDNRPFENRFELTPMLIWNRAYGNGEEKCHTVSNVSLGCCVESLSESHIQSDPILFDGHQYAVIDAVIYNREELIIKCGLESTCEDISDAELLLHFIDHFGPDALAVVNGDFSGAIYNEKVNSLLLFRDHMGIRPLFYYTDDHLVAFSTDLRGLTALSQVDASISETWIYKTIHGYYADTIDNTPYEHIFCVTPASYISFSFVDGKLQTDKKIYWKLRRHKYRLSSEKAYQEKLRELITDAVNRRLNVVSGPVGAELSGGLDSSVIDILINRAGRKGIYFSWSLDPNELKMADNDERLVISDICEQEKITVHYSHMSSDYAPKIVERMDKAGIRVPEEGTEDFRLVFPAGSNTYKISLGAQFAAAHHSKVMFTGHGGDEGISHRSNSYELFHYREYYRFLRHMWSSTHDQKYRIYKTVKRIIRTIRNGYQKKHEAYLDWYASPELIDPVFEAGSDIKNTYNLEFAYDPVAYIESGGSRNRLDNIALLGAYSGVRYLVPYLDYRVIDYAVSIPRYLYLRGNTKRYIFREAFRDIMPKSLYLLNTKEDTSIRNIPPNPDWYDRYAVRRAEIINNLDRNYWKKYLNFEEIDKLANAGEPDDEEYEKESRQLKVLLLLGLAHNLVEKSRSCI